MLRSRARNWKKEKRMITGDFLFAASAVFVSVQLYKVSAPRRRCDVGTFQIETSTILCKNKNSLLCIMLSTLINLP